MNDPVTGLRSRGYRVRITAAAPSLRVVRGSSVDRPPLAGPDFIDRLRPEAEARVVTRRARRALVGVLRMFADPVRRAVAR